MFGINRFDLVDKLRVAKNPNFSDLSDLIVTGLSKPLDLMTPVEAGVHGFMVNLITKNALKNRPLSPLKGERIDPARTKR